MKMIAALVVLALASLISAQSTTVAIARVQGTSFDSGINGYVTFTPAAGNNITITINVAGITQNLGAMHGVHIHQFGDLTLNNGVSVGAHWATNGLNHGCPEVNGTNRHIGDTGNWMVYSNGTLTGQKTLDLIGLTGGLNSVVGFAVIIHNTTDDCAVVASSGNRLAQGVIGVAIPSAYNTPSMNYTQNGAYPVTSYPAVTGAAQAVCVLQPANNQTGTVTGPTGYVWFNQFANGTVQVSANITGLVADNKPRGFHIHQWGDIRAADATSSGPHWTGDTYTSTIVHGIPLFGQPDRPHHMGDMGNIFTYDSTSGLAQYYNVFDSFSVLGTNGLNSIIGRAIVVHNNTDDCTNTNNNGNAGPRIAHCVIGWANPANGGAFAQLTNVPSTQNVANCPAMTTGMATTASVATTAGTSAEPVATTSAAFSLCASLLVVLIMIFA